MLAFRKSTVVDSLYSVSVDILANNTIWARHASSHGGLSANGLSDMFWLIILDELLQIMSVEHSIV